MTPTAPTPQAPPAGPRARPARWIAVSVGVVALGLVVLFATREPLGARFGQSPLVGQPAPELTGTTLTGAAAGGTFDLADHRGRWVLVNFFATWCVPCRVEHPELVRFSEAAGDGALVVSVVFDDEAEDVRRFFEERGGDWPVVDDPEARIALDYGVTGLPETFVVDPRGVVVHKFVGGVTVEGIVGAIQRIEQQRQAGGGVES